MIILLNINFLGDFIYFSYCYITGLFKSIGNFERMEPFIKKFLGLFKDGSSKDYNTSSTITNFIVLRC